MVDNHFFPGSATAFKQGTIYLAIFALNHQQSQGTEVYLRAVVKAGNCARSGFSHYIKRKTYKKDVIHISDRFLAQKLPEFDNEFSDNEELSSLAKFLFINQELRKQNMEQIVAVTRKSDDTMHWQGPFIRMPGSATRSGFGDHRTYYYKQQIIDHHNNVLGGWFVTLKEEKEILLND